METPARRSGFQPPSPVFNQVEKMLACLYDALSNLIAEGT